MTRLRGVPLTRGGWTFFLPDYDARFSEELREGLIDSAFAAIDGSLATRVRRSRHAETWREHFNQAGGLDAYFKVLDPIRGANRIKWLFKRRRAAHRSFCSTYPCYSRPAASVTAMRWWWCPRRLTCNAAAPSNARE